LPRAPERPPRISPKRPLTCCNAGGRYWDRTSDLFRVREARYRCANRPLLRGGDGIRTRVYGFAGRCLASRPLHPETRARQPRELSLAVCLRADDGIRTRDPHLGKVMLYQLSHVRATPTDLPVDVASETLTDRARHRPTDTRASVR